MVATPEGTRWTYELTGGRPCLDFANTVSGIRVHDPHDHLRGYADLVDWGRQVGTVDEARARRLLAEGAWRPEEAAHAFAEAVALREAIHDLFLARAQRRPVADTALATLDAAVRAAQARRRLVRRGAAFALGWDDAPDLLAPVRPVALSAAELLTDEAALDRVRVCGACDDQECGWLFLDESRAGTRRWCSMKDCGNRAKARRFAARARGERGPAARRR